MVSNIKHINYYIYFKQRWAGSFCENYMCFLSIPAGTIGAILGDYIRRFAKPDFIITDGKFLSLVWQKTFWLCGPQVVGMFIGIFVGFYIVAAMFGSDKKPTSAGHISQYELKESV